MIDWGTDFATTTTVYVYQMITAFNAPLTLIIGVGIGLAIVGFFLYAILKSHR